MSTYEEGNATRIIPLVSDDAGATWYPKAGDPTDAVDLTQLSFNKKIRLGSADSGVTWTPKLP